MMKPSLDETRELACSYTVIPVYKEIYADTKTPISLLKNISTFSSRYYLLESVEGGEKWGRYSFIGFDPVVQIKCKNGILEIKNGVTTRQEITNPADKIREILAEYKAPKLDFLPSFTGGFVGYFSYDYIKYTEKSLNFGAESNFYDLDLMLFEKIIAYDHLRQKIFIIINVKTNDLEINYNKAEMEINQIIRLVKSHPVDDHEQKSQQRSEFSSEITKQSFCDMVKKAQEYIKNGDIFQVVLSRTFKADFSGSLLNTYRALRTINPSPYMFFIKSDDLEIAGASPETLVKLQSGRLSTFPAAGTRHRGQTDEEDQRLASELLQDEKELAEHNMLVDLARNDIGRVSKFGSVKVSEYMKIHRFSHVMHITSIVNGEISENKDALDAIAYALPAGTLSGAPKIRACEIIHELEPHARGIYGGAIGYIDFSGNMDVCIAIRMAIKQGDQLVIQSGAGIVADSVPENEYMECENKAKAMLTAVKLSMEEMES